MDYEEYKKRYPHLKDRLTKMEKREKIAKILLDLKDHKGMKLLTDELERLINTINVKLLSPKPLTEKEREVLLTDKERCLWLSQVFNTQEEIIKRTNNYLSKL